MQRVEVALDLTEGEVKRIAQTAKSMGFKDQGQLYLLALVTGFKAVGIDIGRTDPLELIADDVGELG